MQRTPTDSQPNTEDQCDLNNALFNVFYYLTDREFINNSTGSIGKLTYTVLLLNQRKNCVAADTLMAERYFTSYLDKIDPSDGKVRLAGFFYSDDLKFDLFDDYLIGDLWLFGLATGIILFIMLLYLLSVTLVFATLFNVGMSFITAFSLYHLIFGIKFFPFINLLAGLILIAIGADDVFIFFDTWDKLKKQDISIPLDILVAKTLNHATLSIFVTSLTTSAAFFANSVSSIIAIKCFGIFAGIAVVVNLFFMITWTPAIIIMMDKYQKCNMQSILVFIASSLIMAPMLVARLFDFLIEFVINRCTYRKTLGKISNAVFGKVFPMLIEKAWALWLLLFLGVGIGGMVVVFYSPKLKLPHSKDIQLFPDSQLIERWSQELRTNFRYVIDADNKVLETIKIQFVWGIKAKDNGDMFDPDARTTLIQDKSFNLTSVAAQRWMIDFCNDLVKQPFVDPMYIKNNRAFPCMYSYFEAMLSNTCSRGSTMNTDTQDNLLSPCCRKNLLQFPTNVSNLEICLPTLAYVAIKNQMTTPFVLGQVLFNPKNNIPTAFFIEVQTTKSFSTSFEEMKANEDMFEEYFDRWLDSAPFGLKNGWVTSQFFQFYDLQNSIAKGTYYSIILSLSVAFVVMLLTSLNVLITVYALVTITLAIAATIACLVFMGWELNIIESVTISLAVGLSIDYTIHYGIAYRLSNEKYSKARVIESFSRVGSAVFMAALTTFLAGAAMMPSPYHGLQRAGNISHAGHDFLLALFHFLFPIPLSLGRSKGHFLSNSTAVLEEETSFK